MSGSVAIHIDRLGKRFTMRPGAPRYSTLREDLLSLPRRLVSAMRAARKREDFWALRDVSLDVRDGEVLGIIGRNGAGKSTLLKVLGRIVSPTTGSAELRGRVGSLLEVGTGFHPELTGRENVFLSGAMLGMRRREVHACFDAIVAFAEVERFIDTPCKFYSSGMYTRLGFAVAAHLRAEIVLVDEVLAVGDAAFQRRCLGRMGEIAQDGRVVLFVSHNLRELQRLCSRAVLLDAGKLVYDGSPAEAVERYLGRDMASRQKNRFFGERAIAGKEANSLVEVEVRNWNLDSVELCSGPLEFRISCVTSDAEVDLALMIGIYDMLGQRVLFLDSSIVSGLRLRSRDHRLTVHVRLSRDFALRPGDYTLNAALAIHGCVVHHVPDACRVEIHAGNFFGNGRLPDAPVFVAQEWSAEG